MEKKELSIVALSKSNSSKGNFVLVLEEINGPRRLPVIIGPFEAQAIAIALEKVELSRPLTHKLMLDILQRGNTQLKEVIISDIKNDTFFAELVILSNGLIEKIDSRTSDAVALAIQKPCRIYTYEHVLQVAGVSNDDLQSIPRIEQPLEHHSKTELEEMLQEALSKEDYEKAQLIQEVLKGK